MSIHQEPIIEAPAEAVYRVLTRGTEFSRMSGGRAASIEAEAGGAVSMFGGDIEARNVELVPGRRVVQAWRAKAWPEGLWSVVRFELHAEGKRTRIVFDQAGHPAEAAPMLEGGWAKMYWEPMNAMLKGG